MASTIFVDKVDPQSGTALEIGSSGDTMTVPSGATFGVAGTFQNNVTIARVWCLLNGSSFASTDDFNVSGVTDNGTGDYTVTIDTDMGSASYCAVIDQARGSGDAVLGVNIHTRAAGSLRIETCRDDSTKTDVANVSVAIFGDS